MATGKPNVTGRSDPSGSNARDAVEPPHDEEHHEREEHATTDPHDERQPHDETHGHHEPEHPEAGQHPGSHQRHRDGDCDCDCDDKGCGSVVVERNRYFYSKVMTARDFAGEQEYFVSRSRLHNRLLHGWGIVCGLDVVDHPNRDCRNTRVTVLAGIAIDCCGREIVLEKDIVFDLSDHAKEGTGQEGRGATSPAVLCIRYHEEKIEFVPVLYQETGCEPGRREANRLRETPRLELVDSSDLPAGCWRRSGGSADECRDCDDEHGAACLEPSCTCGELIPLAVLEFDEGMHDDIRIDSTGRRHLPSAGDQLTRISWINWPHGGEVTLDELVDEKGMNGRLEVRFDRRLKEAVGDATGINSRTFVAQYVNVQRDLEFLPSRDEPGEYEEGSPRVSPDDACLAVFDIDPHYLNFRSGLAGSTVFVTLKCDFILDCNDNAVDGNHLKGILPSGDGVPGGVFESWFRVVADMGDGRKEAAR